MKKLSLKFRKLLTGIAKFFYGFTEEGKEAKFYDNVLDNMKKNTTTKEVQLRLLRFEMENFLNKDLNIRKLTAVQKELLVQDKFGKK